MARRPSATEAPEEITVTDTEAPVEPTTEETPVEAKPFDLTAVLAAAEVTVAERDETTGVVPTAFLEPVVVEYRKLDGVKAKNAAKKALNGLMTSHMKANNLPLARAYLDVYNSLTAGATPSASKSHEPKAPADPTAAYIDLVAGLTLAAKLAISNTPEGVAEDWADKVNASVDGSEDSVVAYKAWLADESEDKGDAPETPAFVIAAVKLAQGKSARVGKAKSATGTSTYTGVQRDIAKHISEAFADKESGTFLTVADIRKFASSEYGSGEASPGAISARLFPKSGKVTVEGVTPATNEKGVKGAIKA